MSVAWKDAVLIVLYGMKPRSRVKNVILHDPVNRACSFEISFSTKTKASCIKHFACLDHLASRHSERSRNVLTTNNDQHTMLLLM